MPQTNPVTGLCTEEGLLHLLRVGGTRRTPGWGESAAPDFHLHWVVLEYFNALGPTDDIEQRRALLRDVRDAILEWLPYHHDKHLVAHVGEAEFAILHFVREEKVALATYQALSLGLLADTRFSEGRLPGVELRVFSQPVVLAHVRGDAALAVTDALITLRCKLIDEHDFPAPPAVIRELRHPSAR